MTVHTVQKGESLWKISKSYGVSLEALIAANPQITNPDQIDVGQLVNIPTAGAVPTQPMAPISPVPMEPVEDMTQGGGQMPIAQAAPAPVPEPQAAPLPEPVPVAPMPSPAPAYPSVPKWEGLWKYVVKNGDTLFKIAKQVGVTLEHLKAANPQVPNPDKIYPGQVLNIPSSGLKPKHTSGNPGLSLKEQMTMPISEAPLYPKEQLTAPMPMAPAPAAPIPTSPKEMVTMEKPMVPPVMPPMPAPVSPFELNANLNLSPHVNVSPVTNVSPIAQIGNFAHHNQYQQAQAASPGAGSGSMTAKQEMMPHNPHLMQYYHYHALPMMYVPVKVKKYKKCGCHKKHKKCGCHKKHHHEMMHHHMTLMQHMGVYPKTFYREED